MIARDQTFNRVRVQLDGASLVNCTFTNCELHFAGVFGAQIENCNFGEGCTWHLDGAAREAIGFMTAIYQMPGGAALIEATFEQIRGRIPPQAAATTRQ